MTPSDIGHQFFAAQDRNRGPLDAALCAPGYTARITGFPEMTREQHDDFARAFYAGFPDLQHTVETIVNGGDRQVVVFTLRGHHTGPFMGIPPTGKAIAVQAIALLTVSEGRVSRAEGQFDRLGLLPQLGAA